MTKLFHTTSRAALIALIAASPVALSAQEASTETDAEQQQLLPQGETSAEAETEMPATEGTDTDMAEGETDPMMGAEGDADTDMAEGETDPMMGAEGETDMAQGETDPMVGDEGASMGETDMADAEQPAQPVEGQITMQDESTILAADLIGSTVYNSGDERVGDIDDLIIALEGGVEGVVIGVGGFLGLGEKHVAIEMAQLDVMNDDAGNPRLITSATRDDLEAAPEFVTAEEQAQANDAATMGAGTDGTTAPVQ